MKLAVVLTLLAWISAANLTAEERTPWSVDDAAREMTKLNDRLTEAYLREDVQLLELLLDDAHVHNNVFGVSLTKRQFLNDIEKGVLKFERYETPKIKWHIGGDTAVATGTIRARAIRNGRVVPADTFLFTRVFTKRGDKWKVLLFHNTMAAKP